MSTSCADDEVLDDTFRQPRGLEAAVDVDGGDGGSDVAREGLSSSPVLDKESESHQLQTGNYFHMKTVCCVP